MLTVRFGSLRLEVQGGMADYQEMRQRHVAYLASIFPQRVQRLRWPAERLRQERQERLRELLRVALASSPWHRHRLDGVDPESFTEEDLPGLPAMTKDDLMANWDEVVTDRRLTLDLAELPLPRGQIALRVGEQLPGELRLVHRYFEDPIAAVNSISSAALRSILVTPIPVLTGGLSGKSSRRTLSRIGHVASRSVK